MEIYLTLPVHRFAPGQICFAIPARYEFLKNIKGAAFIRMFTGFFMVCSAYAL
jgi:hypothetical protein